jgi:hypothetical protein
MSHGFIQCTPSLPGFYGHPGLECNGLSQTAIRKGYPHKNAACVTGTLTALFVAGRAV